MIFLPTLLEIEFLMETKLNTIIEPKYMLKLNTNNLNVSINFSQINVEGTFT